MADKLVSSFQERLKECLDKNQQYTATALADQIGLSKQAISMYIAGTRKPKRPTVKAIAETLNVNEAWLMGYDVAMERNDTNGTNPNTTSSDIDELNELSGVYLSFAKEAQQSGINPDDLKLAIETIRRLRGE